MITVYEKLKTMREDAALRQCQIAKYLGVTQTFISKVEAGERNLTVDQLERLINLYGYDIDYFINMDQEAQPFQFAFRAQDVSQDDLNAISDITRIAMNSRFMARLLEENNA